MSRVLSPRHHVCPMRLCPAATGLKSEEPRRVGEHLEDVSLAVVSLQKGPAFALPSSIFDAPGNMRGLHFSTFSKLDKTMCLASASDM